MKLVIIEGAGKKETIEKYLGKEYRVFATKGHVRDLPQKSLAININNNFEPKYTILDDKKDIVNELLKKAKSADTVYLATDPDREGEAISWHLAHILGMDESEKVRIEFNEISKKAIEEALAHPRQIDINLVNAQQARRVLDRLVGYKLSPVLCKKIQSKLSGGRVQSVALKLITDREREIQSFVPVEFWNLTADLKKRVGAGSFKAQLHSYKNKKIKINNKEEADKAESDVKGKDWIVQSVKKSLSKSHAPAPFTTSTLGQDALNKLGLSLKQTSAIAQTLYEGIYLGNEGKVALVTYIRTDSTRVAKDAQQQALEFINQKFGDKFVPPKPNLYASKSNSQDAHEAIRPITLTRDPESIKGMLDRNAYRLYKLIYDRFLASQMSEAVYDAVSVDVAVDDYIYRASGKTLVFEGYLAAYSMFEEKNADDEPVEGKIPPLTEGEVLDLVKLDKQQKFTKPPARITEAGLIKLMEEKGIGRPATYAPTVSTLLARQYLEKEGKQLVPTELGFNVADMLVRYFPNIMDVSFTADMESKLDEIGEGDIIWQKVISDFYKDFAVQLAEATGDSFSLKEPPKDSDVVCDKCGANMLIRKGRFGEFLACPNFPKCKNTMRIEVLDKNKDELKASANAQQEKCEKCGSPMVERSGKYGKFLACSNYPECKNIRNNKSAKKEVLGDCPECGKPLARKHSRKSSFIACTGYPNCRFTTNYPIFDQKCDSCGGAMVIKKDSAVCLKCEHTIPYIKEDGKKKDSEV